MAMAAAFSLASCSVAEQFPEDLLLSKRTHTVKVKFVTASPDTRTAFGEFDETNSAYPAFWTGADLSVAISLNLAEPVDAEVVKDSEVSKNASFTAIFKDTGSPYDFFALSPLSAANAVSGSRNSWSVTIPTVQTPKADGLSCDEAAMLLFARSGELEALPADPVQLQFGHITTYCRLALKNLAAAFQSHNVTDPSVKSVDLTYSVPVAGEWYVNASDGTLEEKEASYTVTLRPEISDLTQPTDIWYALAPCTLDGATVRVSVNTDKGSLSREYTFGTRTYAAGAVNKLSLDMTKNASFDEYSAAEDETVFELVTSMNGISKNDEVIFADTVTPAYAMTSTTNSTSGIKAIAKDADNGFTYSARDSYIRLPEGSNVMVMTVSNKTGSSLSFKYGNKYLERATSSNTHYLTLASSARVFTSSINNGIATLSYLSNSKKTKYSVYYDSGHFNIFDSQSSQTKDIAIFKKKTVTTISRIDPENDPVLEQEQYGAYLSGENSVHIPQVSQLSREYSGYAPAFAIIFPAGNSVLEFNGIPAAAAKGDKFSLTVTRVTGRQRTSLGTFQVTVIKEDGAKLWLTDFNGNGFIVKR